MSIRKTVNLSAPLTRAITTQIKESLERRPQFVQVAGHTIALDNIVGLYLMTGDTYSLIVRDGIRINNISLDDAEYIRRVLLAARRP